MKNQPGGERRNQPSSPRPPERTGILLNFRIRPVVPIFIEGLISGPCKAVLTSCPALSRSARCGRETLYPATGARIPASCQHFRLGHQPFAKPRPSLIFVIPGIQATLNDPLRPGSCSCSRLYHIDARTETSMGLSGVGVCPSPQTAE